MCSSRPYRRSADTLMSSNPTAFDYIVIDEFHHASASSYRRLIEHFEPTFLIGLTATPDRMDGADLLALCGDNLVFECNLVEGIRRNELVAFQYQGLKDLVDFAPDPVAKRQVRSRGPGDGHRDQGTG